MPARRAICGYSGGGELIKCCLNSSGSSRTPPRNVTCKRFFQLSHQSALLPVQVTVLVAVCVAAVAMLDADSSNPIWLNFCASRCLCSSSRDCRRAVCSSTYRRRIFRALLRSFSPAPPPFNAPEARTGPSSWVSMFNPSEESASMRSAPPFSTLASMVAAKFRGRNTTISPLPEDNCDGPGKRTGREASPDSGVIHAVIVPLPVAARTTFETRVRQMPPPLVSTSIGPETYITRTPPPPVSAWTEPCTSPKSIWPPPVRTPTNAPASPTVIFPPSVSSCAVPRMWRPTRSEEHTSELQSPDHLVCRLLLEKKNMQ